MNYFLIWIVLYFFTLPVISLANLSDDIYIDSDILTLNQRENSATFEGEVILWFEDMMLKTSNLKVIYKETLGAETSIDKIIIQGKVKAIKTETGEVIIADSAEYNVERAELTLLGNVVLQREDHILKAKKLLYHGHLKSIGKK